MADVVAQAMALHRAGRTPEALKSLRAARGARSLSADGYRLLGQILATRSAAVEATEILNEACARFPSDQRVARDCAVAHTMAADQDRRRAHLYLRRAADLLPSDTALRRNLALALLEAGEHDDAVAIARTLQGPENGWGLYIQGRIADEAGNPEAAIEHLSEGLKLQAGVPMAGALASALLNAGQPRQARAVLEPYRDAMVRDPALAMLYANAAFGSGDARTALHGYRAVAAANRTPDLARYLAGICNICLGNLVDGFRGYASRPAAFARKFDFAEAKRTLSQDSASVDILADQGIGDGLLYLRFLLACPVEFQARARLVCDARLHGLLSRAFPHLSLMASTPDLIRAHLEGGGITLADLPVLFDLRAVPPPVSLSLDPARVASQRARLAESGPGPYVGITWRSGASVVWQGFRELKKEVSLAGLLDALDRVDATIVLLQDKITAEEWALLDQRGNARYVDWSDAREDLDDLAARLAALDDYVCVSNTNLHLRAAVTDGPTRVIATGQLIALGLEGPSAPWYPTVRVYRGWPTGSVADALTSLKADLIQPS